MFPDDFEGCRKIIDSLLDYQYILGVFPPQAQEVITAFWNSSGRFYSAVNKPIIEPETGKVREFKFIRWACVG